MASVQVIDPRLFSRDIALIATQSLTCSWNILKGPYLAFDVSIYTHCQADATLDPSMLKIQKTYWRFHSEIEASRTSIPARQLLISCDQRPSAPRRGTQRDAPRNPSHDSLCQRPMRLSSSLWSINGEEREGQRRRRQCRRWSPRFG